ncbi:S14_ClpP_1 domain containing protein [uncultured Caudovirales phage]|uniref:S14_ClpP_1 domain containing protein n=1 Tax=uncultured Caudovirales phage TaxID=2100421 RepID=A0A6J5LCL3_9CAUD|nr:S14_ClpP_1 domain containing protein [uncultured Caudovirales phage]
MIYCIDPTVDEPIMLITKHIGFDEQEGQGVDGSLFQQELLQLDTLGKKRIQIWINSPGGVVADGYSIYSAILKSNTPVDTYCVGCAASIAGVIFQAGRKRIMADYSWLMYHNPFGSDNGDVIATMKKSIVTMIASRCGMSENEVDKMMNRTSFILADEAIKMKLCDEIDSSVQMNTKYLRKITDSLQFHKECNKVVNTILNNNTNINTMSMTKVTMRLKLNDAAREDDVVAAIDSIENRAKTAEENLQVAILDAQNKAKNDSDAYDKMKAEFDKKKAELDKLKAEMEDCKNELDAMKTDKQKAEDEAKKEKAKNMIENFAKVGKIKNDATTILKWSNLAVADFEGTKNMLEDLPLNKVAPVITNTVVNKLQEGQLPTNAVGLMAYNRLKREGKI